MRWRSFAAREDLARSEPPPLPEEGEGGGTPPGAPEILLASDPWGVPVVLFSLLPVGEEWTEVRFAVPREAGASFQEALRLLSDLLTRRGDVRELRMQLPHDTPMAAAVLEACGWEPGPGKVWMHAPGGRGASAAKPTHAG